MENLNDQHMETQCARAWLSQKPKTVSNTDAVEGDQLGLFGEATKTTKPLTTKRHIENPTKGKQRGLFDTKGNPDQMDLFGGEGIPEELTYRKQ